MSGGEMSGRRLGKPERPGKAWQIHGQDAISMSGARKKSTPMRCLILYRLALEMRLLPVQWQRAGRKKEPAGRTAGSRCYEVNCFEMAFRTHADTVRPSSEAAFSTASAITRGSLMFNALCGAGLRPAP